MIDFYKFYSQYLIEDFNDLHLVIKAIQTIVDIEWYSLLYFSTKLNLKEAEFITNNEILLTEKYSAYIKNNQIINYCLKNTMPFIWDCNSCEEKIGFYHHFKNYGISHGVTFPIHGINNDLGILTLSFYCKNHHHMDIVNENFAQLISLRDIIIYHLNKMKTKDRDIVRLSKREKEVCSWYLIGKTTWEISKILNCSEANVNFHFKKIREKFNVNSRSAAIIKAIENGQITL